MGRPEQEAEKAQNRGLEVPVHMLKGLKPGRWDIVWCTSDDFEEIIKTHRFSVDGFLIEIGRPKPSAIPSHLAKGAEHQLRFKKVTIDPKNSS